MLVVAGCSGSRPPLEPSGTDYTGVWHLTATGTATSSPDFYCPQLTGGARKEYVLRLVQEGSAVTGVVVETPTLTLRGFATNLSGSVSADGHLTLNGSFDDGIIRRQIRIAANYDTLNFLGTIDLDRETAALAPCSQHEVVLAGSRTPLDSSWSGGWAGQALMRACTTTTETIPCSLGPTFDIHLRLVATGRLVGRSG